MANEENKNENQENEAPAPEEQPLEGLTADQAAESPYDATEVWNKNKNSLYILLGAIAIGVAAVSWFNTKEQEEEAERSSRFIEASMEPDAAEERFLAFAEDYDDTLGGVAKYRAAIIQYKDKRYEEAIASFQGAITQLGNDPLVGRATLALGISQIKAGQADAGKATLAGMTGDMNLLPTDRREAHFHLAVQAIEENDDASFAEQVNALGSDINASDLYSRLMDLNKTRELLSIAQSLPDLNKEAGEKFLAENLERKEVNATESGLQYEILTSSDDNASPLADDEVEVHYHGTLINGEVFDSSVDRGEPSKFKVNQVISGWTEALQLMTVGDKWKLYIPSDLAYGETGNNSIGPNETLIFEVELIGITPKEIPELSIDGNSSSAEASIVIPDVDSNATIPVVEANATESTDGNGSK
jgi:FKBP-type peptidyl-prolyl cis-trans isomerase/predicted negative regulator of RcsB-dependent stress response